MIEEQMIHGIWRERRGQESGDRRQGSGKRRQESESRQQEAAVWSVKDLPRKPIEAETPIVPYAVAVAVWEEASAWLGAQLPLSWIGQLTERANNVYANNSRFRSLLQRDGNAGRDPPAKRPAAQLVERVRGYTDR